ncbi:DUF3999 family protein [Paenibacillus sp. MMS20-IR301]|uniref:DUF3999 family protein n=1 Tax=Paenibacillus sp. MMS20-IR301 TaxID=2895946 RepID=UPI0028F01265|nr:DUF3999 family protein [Paenibacillus sp. MMS20-IR301]WNS42458.1 DUF3999 family protein [Paenibacillus sp. MMS20-IR301]
MQRRIKISRAAKAAVLLAGLCGMLAAVPASGYLVQDAAAAGTAVQPGGGEWAFSREITAPQASPYYKLYLDEGVYRSAAEDLRDLRILSRGGTPVPYYLESGEQTAEEHAVSYLSTLVHRADKGADTVLDYRIAPLAEHTDIQGNRLVFELPDEAFLKHVEVWGGYDGKAWEMLSKGDLYTTNGITGDSIGLDGSYKFSYYRLIVKSNPEKLDFPALTLIDSSRELRTEEFMRRKTLQYQLDQAENRTEIVISNTDRLRITRLMLESTGNFSRRYELYDHNGIRMQVEGSGKLYRLDFKNTLISETEIRLAEASSAAELRIIIYNLDDAPIAVTGLEADYKVDRLIFAGGEQEPYLLVYGNALATAPQYDIINFKDQIGGGQLITAALGTERSIASQAAEPPAEDWFQSERVFNAIIIAVSVLLIVIVTRRLSRRVK